MKKKLSAPQEIFCREYLVDLDAAGAYLRTYAGANESSAAAEGARLLASPGVAARLRELMLERNESRAVTHDWVVFRLKRVAERAMVGRPDYGAATRALELLGKHVGLFREPPAQVLLVEDVPTPKPQAAAWPRTYGPPHQH